MAFLLQALLGLLLLLPSPSKAQEPVVVHDPLDLAMSFELARSSDLKPEGYPPPYYVGLAATDMDTWERVCAMGRVRFLADRRQRVLTPDIRVGSPELDNHPVGMPSDMGGRSLPFENDVFALRHGLWRLMDLAYKGATADFLRKQALRVSRGKAEYDYDDFTRETPGRTARVPASGEWPQARLERLCVEASREFRKAPWLLHTEVSVALSRERWRLRDTEGLDVSFPRDIAEVELEAVDIATDGLKVSASRRYFASSEGGLPGLGAVVEEARAMAADLAALKTAVTTSPFDAPALLDPSVVAAVVLSVGTRLSGEEQRNPSGTQVFRDKLGTRVLSPILTLVDDPTLESFQGRPLVGTYAFDNQGVPAQRVTLIERGVLKGFLLSRYPVKGFPRSNGHGRRAAGYLAMGVPGNLILSASKTVTEEEMLRLLSKELKRRGKPHGIWVRKLHGFSQSQSTGRQDALRVFARLVYMVDAKTGAKTLVRNLDVVCTPLTLMESILAAGDRPEVTDLVSGVPVSVIAPSLLVSGVELQRSEAKPEKGPILPPPPVE
ncbi:MAG: metallopeptidase TldD-related protein [Elusimicrobiota bacterium]|jgi:predicted Zn-dependent protease